VLPHSGLTAPFVTTGTISVDVRRLPWLKRLVTDYAFDFPRLAGFYAGNPSSSQDWREALARVRRHRRASDRVADLVATQLRSRGAPPEALSAASQLRDPDTVAVVTGQQAGLFGGPLFTLLKALTAVRLAEQVRTEHRTPAVAIFWVDAEDHDWDEVRSCGLLDADLVHRQVALEDLRGARQQPVASLRLDESIRAAIDALEAILPATEFTPDLLSALRSAYEPGTGMADAFARWIDRHLGPRGLVVFNSADPASKPLLADLFTHEIEHRPTARLAARAGAALEALGYHAQVAPGESSLALFHLQSGRQAIRVDTTGFVIDGVRVAAAELLAQVRQRPEAFSPGVLLRPLAQDTLFPTACYVAGPSELAYLGQLKGVYEAFGVPMPLIQPRAMATIVDGNAMRFLLRHELAFERLRAQDEAALNELLGGRLPPGVEASLERAARTLESELGTLAGAIAALDPTLEGATRSTLTRVQDDLKKLQAKIIQAAKRKDETLRRQFRHAQAQAFPAGQPQEREIASVYFLNRFGPTLIERLSELLPGEAGTHYVMAG
jgi:bacillithiol biosynthesis cysteine-adding enzyme BshC